MSYLTKMTETSELWTEIEHLRKENAKLKTMMRHAIAERTGVYFICGEGGARDSNGLPSMIMICPSPGADGFAVYTKTSDYSAPAY